MHLFDVITNVVLIILLVISLRGRFKKRSATAPTSADDKSAVGKFTTAAQSVAEARAKLDALTKKVESELSGESEDLREDIHHLHAVLDAEIVYAETHHDLIG